MSSVATIRDLPIELHIDTLDLLIGDPQALYACSLTCRSWADRAQRNLYRIVTVDERNSAAFCAALSRRPQLAEHIRELTLDGVQRLPGPPRNVHSTGIQLLRLVAMDTSNPWLRPFLTGSRQSIRRLSLRHCNTDDAASFLAFLAEMPRLKNIEIDRSSFRSTEAPVECAMDVPNLQSLCLVGEHCNTRSYLVVHALLAYPQAYAKLSIIKIRLAWENLPAFGAFLEVVGGGLRELDLGLGPKMATAGQSVSQSALGVFVLG